MNIEEQSQEDTFDNVLSSITEICSFCGHRTWWHKEGKCMRMVSPKMQCPCRITT